MSNEHTLSSVEFIDKTSADDTPFHRRAVLGLAIQSSGMGVWEHDLATGKVWWSEELEAIFGVEKGTFGGTQQHFFDLLHPDDREHVAEQVSHAIESSASLRFEFRFLRPDGQVRWMEARGHAIYDPDGDARRVYGVGIDITDRKAKDERERFLQQLSYNLQPLTDPAEIMATTAKMLGDHLGADRCAYAEVESESIFVITGDYSLHLPSIVGRWPVAAFGKECERQMLANEAYVVEDSENDERISSRDLEAYRATNIVAVICVPLHKLGRFTAAMAVHQASPRSWTEDEIELVETVVNRCWESLERCRAERTVRESEERFRLALSSGAVTVYEQDEKLRYRWVYPSSPFRTDIIGKTDEEISPGPGARLRTKLKQSVLDTGQAVREEASSIVAGQERWYDVLVEPRYDENGKVVGVGGTELDITDRKKAEKELRSTFDRLALAIAAADLGDWSWEATTDRAIFSRRAEDMFGLSPGQEITWTELQDRIPEPYRSEASEQVLHAMETGTRYEMEYPINRPNGTQIWVSALGRPHGRRGGKHYGMYGVVQDISDRKKLEAELRESESRFRALMEQAPFSVQLFRPDGRHISVNRAWEKLWGARFDDIPEYNVLEDAQLEARGIASLIRRVFAGETLELPTIVYDPEETVPGVTRYKDSKRWVSALAYPLKDDAGEVTEVVLIHQDITASKRAEEVLERYRLLSECARDIIWLARPDGQLVEVNQAAVDAYGYSRDELLTMNIADLRATQTLKDLPRQLAEAARGGIHYETLHKRRDGSEFPVEVNANSGDLGGERLIMGIVRDITERKHAESELMYQKTLLESLTESVLDGIMIVSATGETAHYNKVFHEIWRFPDEVLSSNSDNAMLEWAAQQTVDPEEFLRRVGEIYSNPEQSYREEVVMKDGRVYERYGAPVFSGKERLGWVWTFHEITARKQAERSILEAQHELESKVAARTRDLKDMNSLLLQQITERERAEGERLELLKRLFTVQEDERGRIARDIHDQLGQRVTALRMGIAQVKSFCSDGDRLDQQIERLEQLAAQLDEEVSFVSWELRPSALDSGDFAKSLGSYVNEWSRYSGIKAKFHSAEIDSSDLDTNVQTNLYRITQEALNNASKHSAAERVNVLLERRGDTLVLIIEDNGVGFDVEDMPRERDLNRGFGTVGMRERASLIGGTFEIESETGKGTTVIVRVPLQQHRI